MKKTFGPLFALVVLLIAAFFLWIRFFPHQEEEDHEEHEQTSSIEMDEKTAEAHGIHLMQTRPAVLDAILQSRGKVVLHPDKLAHILPNVSGVAYSGFKNRGDKVVLGDVLALIESRQMAEEKAAYLAAFEKERLSASFYDREKGLFEKKISSEQEYLNAKAAWEEAKIQLMLTRQKLFAFGLKEEEIDQMVHQSGKDFRFYEVKAPISGTIIDRDITYGEYVSETTSIYTIADLSSVWVEMGIYPKDFQYVKEGQVVEVENPCSGLNAAGKIVYISPIINEETITAKAIVELDNEKGDLKPGSFVLAKVHVEKVPVPLAIAKKAVQMIDGEAVVFVKTEGGFEKTAVRLGRSDDNQIEVIAGLEQDTTYAASGVFLLKADLGKDSVEHED